MTEENYADLRVPFRTKLKAQKRIRWCSCGMSKTQPFCDDSHDRTGFLPKLYRSDQDITVALCGCKETCKPPFCDGSHLRKSGKDANGRLLPNAVSEHAKDGVGEGERRE